MTLHHLCASLAKMGFAGEAKPSSLVGVGPNRLRSLVLATDGGKVYLHFNAWATAYLLPKGERHGQLWFRSIEPDDAVTLIASKLKKFGLRAKTRRTHKVGKTTENV